MKITLTILSILLLSTSCKVYSFSGATVPKEVKSISIEYIRNNAPNAWVTVDRIFNQELRNKFTRDGGLKVMDKEGDYAIKGFISRYSIVAQTPTQGAIANKYRLDITVLIEFQDHVTDKKVQWTENFNSFEVYDGDISGKEDQYIQNISENLSNAIFNKMFSTW